MKLIHPTAKSKGRRGMALVLMLAFIVMLTVVAVAFFSAASNERQISGASSQLVSSASLARSAVEDVIGMLREEMVAGSLSGSEFSASGSTDLASPDRVLIPVSAQTSRPFRFPGAAGNVWKWSQSNQPFFAGNTYNPPSSFAGASALAAEDPASSRNGRFVASARWQAPALAVPQDLPQPEWIYLTRSGAKPSAWSNTLRDPNPANPDLVVGRYAFILYQTGGLLDVNVAGYPNTVPSSMTRQKAGLSFADLSVIDPALSGLPAWRDAVSGSTFPARALSGNVTFLRTTPGDRLFASRGQMVSYLRSLGVAEENLSLLTHFTRELNAPSWGPIRNSDDPEWNGYSSFPYRDDWNNPASTNRLLPNVRVGQTHTTTSYDVDGQPFLRTVLAGDPVIPRRFSLDKLAWLTRNGPAPGISEEAIQVCFGLRWNNGRWDYTGATGNTVLSAVATLAEVTAARREANFFEFLKAAILEGSLGMTTAPVPLGGDTIGINDWLPYNGGSTGRAYNGNVLATQHQLTDSQIIQLGLNILDQADADSFPSRIFFRGFEFYGVENIPYLYRFSQIPYRPQNQFAGMTPPGPDRRMVTAWLEPAVWNPLRGPATDVPQRFRIRLVAGSINYFFRQSQNQPSTTAAQVGPTSPAASAGANIVFSGNGLSAGASTPVNLVQLGATVEVPRTEYRFTGDGQNWIGFWGGEAPISLGEDLTHGIFTLNGSAAGGGPRFVLEVDYGGGDFREVQRFGFGATGGLWYGVTSATYQNCRVAGRRSVQFGFNDPRTNRFGVQGFDFGGDRPDLLGGSQFWSASQRFNGQYNPKDANFTPPDPTGNPWFARASFRYGDNSGEGGGPVYADRDGIQRPADGIWESTSSNTLPMREAQDYRPIQLNRPFRSPGELGVVFRDLPWKSIDFWSARSADAGLLDVFCVGSEGGREAILAGRVDINSSQPRVLASLLAGAARAENPGGLSLPATAGDLTASLANQVATALVTATSASPAVNRADLVEVLQSVIEGEDFASNIKSRREAVLRSLSQAGQTRTWTFLLDLVAQSGRMAVNADGLDDFIVEGERRVWAHIAMDRITGKVIDLELEQVDE